MRACGCAWCTRRVGDVALCTYRWLGLLVLLLLSKRLLIETLCLRIRKLGGYPQESYLRIDSPKWLAVN